MRPRGAPPPVVTTPAVSRLHLSRHCRRPIRKQADWSEQHDAAWRWFQAGDLARAETRISGGAEALAGVLSERDGARIPRRSPAAATRRRSSGSTACCRSHAGYVPALVGRGEALLAQSREADALAAFESGGQARSARSWRSRRRVEVLRARAAQENVAAARRAAQANRLDEAARLYEKAIAASPDSAFLVRDLADVEAKQGKTDEALARYRRAIELDPSDAASRIRIGEILDARGDLEGAMKLYTRGQRSRAQRRAAAADGGARGAARVSAAAGRIPRHSRAHRRSREAIWRRSSASGSKPLLQRRPRSRCVITDARNHWAADWIMATARAGVMEPYENHTFQPRECDHAQRSRAGGQPAAEDHRRRPARSC